MRAVVDRMVKWGWIGGCFVSGDWEEGREGAKPIAGERWLRQSDSKCKSPGAGCTLLLGAAAGGRVGWLVQRALGTEAGGRTFHVGHRKDLEFFPSETEKNLRLLKVMIRLISSQGHWVPSEE